MKIFFNRLFSILSYNTLIALVLAIVSTLLSVHFKLQIKFEVTMVGIAVVFPIVFSIGGAYSRREAALVQYGIMKSMGRTMYYASRDWLRDSDEKAKSNIQEFKDRIYNILTLCVQFFKTSKNDHFSKVELDIYHEFSALSVAIEDLRDRGLSGSEVSRVNAYLNKFINAFETIKHIYQYRTPRTLRMYSKLFIYVMLVALGPFFAKEGTDIVIWLVLLNPILFALVLTGIDNIQELLENPFDQIGEDDIKINPEKFINSL